jgi:PBS lyase HEAT-like repeat-containing protein
MTARTDARLVNKRVIRIFAGLLTGIFVVAGLFLLLIRNLGNHETMYAGKTLGKWAQQLNSTDAGASNQANEVLNTQIIPGLVDQMFHDTNDSPLRLSLVKSLNRFPGVHIFYNAALSRRSNAASDLGDFGPSAKAAVPFLIQALQGPQVELHEAAIQSLGRIHSNPDVVLPLLVPCLTNDDLNEDAAIALGNFGSVAREAFPKIVPLLKNGDPHVRVAARTALKKIDPETAAKTEGVEIRKRRQ